MKVSRRPWSLYHADVFHLCLLCSPTFWTLHLWSRLGARLPPAPAITQNLSSIVPFDFSQMRHVLTSISLPIYSHQAALSSSSCFSSGFTAAYEHLSKLHLWSSCFPQYGYPCVKAHHHYQSSSYHLSSSNQQSWSHFWIQHGLNTWTFYTHMLLDNIQEHKIISPGLHYVSWRRYVHS